MEEPAVQNAGAATKANVKATAGRVYGFRVTNANAALRYFLIHDKATAPVATDVPIFFVPLPAGTAASPSAVTVDRLLLQEYGIRCATGIGWAISTTATSFTDSATAGDHTVTLFAS